MIYSSNLLFALMLALQSQPATQNAVEETAAPTESSEATTPADTAAEEGKANDDEKVICRSTQVIGSKFKKRLCGTKKQWKSLSQRGKDTTATFQRRGKGLEPVN